jgi:hypothetical protein
VSAFERREHHETGELCYVARNFDPPPHFKPRRKHGVLGRPHLSLWLFADRAVFERGWCFCSGQMEVYEEEVEATLAPERGVWPAELRERVATWFGEGLWPEASSVLEEFAGTPEVQGQLYACLVQEARNAEPFYQLYWGYGPRLGVALARIREAAKGNGIPRPVLCSADPALLESVDCEVERSDSGEVFWSVTRNLYPPDLEEEEPLALPFGVIPASQQPEDAHDPDEIAVGYTLWEAEGVSTLEINVAEVDLLALYQRFLTLYEPFQVFWYKVHGQWDDTPLGSEAPDEIFINEGLTSKDEILAHVEFAEDDSLRNGFVTLTSYAEEGATNLDLSDHKKVVISTTSPAQRDRALEVLAELELRRLEPFVTVDDRIAHWHYRPVDSKDRAALIEHLLATGFSPWAPD